MLTFAGCGGDAGPEALLQVMPDAAQQSLQSTPWPSDLLLENGHVMLGALPTSMTDLTQPVLDDLHTLEDGFSTTAGAFFPVSAALDAATLDGNVHLYDLASGEELPVYTHLRAKDTPVTIYARPVIGGTLLEHHAYAYVITNRVKGPSGALHASAELTKILDGKAAEPRAGEVYRPLTDALAKGMLGSLKPEDIAAATVFTTHTITGTLAAMRAALGTSAPPKATVSLVFAKVKQGANAGSLDELLGTPAQDLPGTDNMGGIAHSHIGYVIQGTFPSPDYLNNESAISGGGGTPSSIDTFDNDAGMPHPKGTATVPFTLVLPDLAQPEQYQNLPVLIFQHGLGGDRSSVMAIADDNAKLGFATIGLDIPFHGGRDVTAVDMVHNFGGASGPDGWAEISDASFVSFFDATGNQKRNVPAFLPRAIRDAFMQAALDCMQETRLVTAGDVSDVGVKEPRLAMLSFRKDALGYSGESFGSMIGAIVNAIEPSIGAASLDVGGGGLLFPLLLNSAGFAPKIGPFLDGALGTQTADPEDPADTDFAYNLSQYLLELGDAAAYAPYIVLHPIGQNAPKHLLQPSAHLDETVPNQANVALARAAGAQPVALPSGGAVDLALWAGGTAMNAPVSGNVMVNGKPVTAAFIQFEQASHGMFTSQHGAHTVDVTKPYPFPKIDPPVPIQNPIVRLHAIYGAFFADYFAGKVPTVVSGP